MSEIVYDENFIRNFLKKTIEDIATPFIERRINSGGHKENLQDEIIELLQIINENEEQIKTLIQLGYYLLERGQENVQEKQNEMENLQQQIYDCETQIEFHKQSVHEYQRLYHEQLEKNNRLQDTIAQIESESTSNQKAYENIKKELQKLRTQSQKMGKPEDLENLKQNLLLHQQENTDLKSQLSQQKTDNKQLRDEFSNLTKTYEKQIKSMEKVEYENKNQKNVIKNLEFKVKEQKSKIQQLEELVSIQIKEIEELKKQNNSLERDIASLVNKGTQNSVSSPKSISKADLIAQQLFTELKSCDEPGLLENRGSGNLTPSSASTAVSNANTQVSSQNNISITNKENENKKNSMQIFLQAHGNLLSELKDFKDGEMFNENANVTRNSPRARSNSKDKIKLDANNLKTTGKVTNSKPQPIRRDPYEEFFMLTSQCVKLNSPFLDDILALDCSGYYKQVLEQYIPYHKWYKWIEEKLYSIRKQLLQEQQQDLLQHQLIQY
ncbi:hypothetical protein TTHERM_00357100 (macronuclear) [Tetrahymena thermophila SB210]|uniref:Uncharacterized protein n=1 Tax=Tetrahymena thermophila (strain SB210) TaxID=312017 RepID=Q22XW1_TETTS|nr:hypothetical protein TTHERM_00357100 [Tetrahymena thermophila SB210]EAR90263.2 hypothetical protein TTHERM_00357100 [Tetrahymena thermophila SB210]|eukprot:XP_001010508.2 hypothetical protein TTHERM_00357100 [Tetrahymena thermophila SB210]